MSERGEDILNKLEDLHLSSEDKQADIDEFEEFDVRAKKCLRARVCATVRVNASVFICVCLCA